MLPSKVIYVCSIIHEQPIELLFVKVELQSKTFFFLVAFRNSE